MWASILLLILLPAVAFGATPDPLKICTTGDPQEGTDCVNAAPAWDYWEAEIQYIVDHPSLCDVVVFPGDVVTGLNWQSQDCWCATQEVSVEVCPTLTNPDLGTACPADACDKDPAKTCDGGTVGTYCEWERVETLRNMLAQANIPYIFTSGNHCRDSNADDTRNCQHEMTVYNNYLGAGKLSPDFDEYGLLEHSLPCAALDDGDAEQGVATYHVLTAGGTQWLFITLPWVQAGKDIEGMGHVGVTDASFQWAQDVIDAHLGMPTIFIGHGIVSEYCGGLGAPATYATDYEDAWCGRNAYWWETWVGTTIYDEFLKDPVRAPQILAAIGGHIRDNAYWVTQNTLYPTAGIAFDYTNPIAELQADCSYQIKANGGGGILTVIRIDPQANMITTKAYSPYEGAWCDVRGAEPATHYELNLPMCSNNSRFNFPAATCPEREPSPECCHK